MAHVPHTIVTPYQGGDPSDVFSNPLYAPPRGYDKHYPGQVSNFMDMHSEMLYVIVYKKVHLYTVKNVVKCVQKFSYIHMLTLLVHHHHHHINSFIVGTELQTRGLCLMWN